MQEQVMCKKKTTKDSMHNLKLKKKKVLEKYEAFQLKSFIWYSSYNESLNYIPGSWIFPQNRLNTHLTIWFFFLTGNTIQ